MKNGDHFNVHKRRQRAKIIWKFRLKEKNMSYISRFIAIASLHVDRKSDLFITTRWLDHILKPSFFNYYLTDFLERSMASGRLKRDAVIRTATATVYRRQRLNELFVSYIVYTPFIR